METKETQVDELDVLLGERGYSATDRALVEAFLRLPADMRETVARAVVRLSVGIVGSVRDDGIPFRTYGREEWTRAMDLYQKAMWFSGLSDDGKETAKEDCPDKASGV